TNDLIDEQPGGDDGKRDGYGNNLSPGASRDGFVRLDLGFEFDSFRRDLKRPGKNQRHGETEDDDDNKDLNHPLRGVESREENRRRLNQEPRDDRIRDRDFVNVASFQLGEEIVDLHFEFRNAASSRVGRIFSASASKRASPWSGFNNGSKR